MRCDVNCGLNTRAELARCDPAIAAELERAFRSGATYAIYWKPDYDQRKIGRAHV